MSFRSINFIADFFRPDQNNFGEYYCDINNKWLYLCLKEALGEKAKLVNRDNFLDVINDSSLVSWPQQYDAKPSEELIACFKELDGLIIGFELSPMIQNAINRAKRTYIDIRLHPIRFMQDLYFALNSNDKQINDRIKAKQISYKEMQLEAGFIKAKNYREKSHLKQEDYKNTCLVVGQMPVDSSVINNGKFHSLDMYLDEISNIQADNILFKPHPWNKLENDLPYKVTQENIYSLLANEEITNVVGLSSSVLFEAELFNKKSHHLLPPRYKYFGIGNNIYNAIGQDILYPNFWSDVINMDLGRVNFTFRPNLIRQMNQSYWGFEAKDKSEIINK